MDFKQIEAFASVAKHKSFSRAAEAIYLSQPTVSAHISSLEAELDTILFDRLGKEIQLTPAGLVFYEYAVNMLNTRDHALSSMSEYYGSIKGELSIASSTTPCKCILPPLIEKFSHIYPSVNFKISGTSTGEAVARVLSFEAEIGIVGKNVPDERLIYSEIADDNLVVITPVSEKFSRIDGDSIDFKDIQLENFILREQDSATRQIFESVLGASGHSKNKLHILSEVSSMDAALQFVKYGLGITIISESAAKEYVDSGYVKKYNVKGFELKRKIYLVVYGRKTLSPAARAFQNFIIASKDRL